MQKFPFVTLVVVDTNYLTCMHLAATCVLTQCQCILLKLVVWLVM